MGIILSFNQKVCNYSQIQATKVNKTPCNLYSCLFINVNKKIHSDNFTRAGIIFSHAKITKYIWLQNYIFLRMFYMNYNENCGCRVDVLSATLI